MAIHAADIATHLGLPLEGPNVLVSRPYPASDPGPGAFVFVKEYGEAWAASLGPRADVCVLGGPEFRGKLRGAHIVSGAPRLDFARVLSLFFRPERETGIAATARIHPTARLGEGVAVGEYSVIGPGVVIGDRTVVRNHVVIYRECRIGSDCLIKSSTIIGEEGFGFEFGPDGVPIRIPHLGRVVIGDDVEVGALNVIARGTLGDTVLSSHAKTDDHVFIAHNVFVGENSVIIAGAEVSGGVKIGRDVWISPQATIINKVSIGDRALVGLGAVVIEDVPAGMIVVGNPAKVKKPRPA